MIVLKIFADYCLLLYDYSTIILWLLFLFIIFHDLIYYLLIVHFGLLFVVQYLLILHSKFVSLICYFFLLLHDYYDMAQASGFQP